MITISPSDDSPNMFQTVKEAVLEGKYPTEEWGASEALLAVKNMFKVFFEK